MKRTKIQKTRSSRMTNTVFKMLTLMFIQACHARWELGTLAERGGNRHQWDAEGHRRNNIIAIIPWSSSPLSSSSAIYYIIASSQLSSSSSSEYLRWSATYRQGKRASTSKAWKNATCDQTASEKEELKKKHEKSTTCGRAVWKEELQKRNVIKLYMWPDYVWNGNW